MDRRFRRTETAIRNAYFDLLISGHGKITVAEIARKADIDRKTFYLHYQTADDIAVAFAEEKTGQLQAMLEEHHFYEKPHDLSVLFRCLNELMAEDIDLYRALSKDHKYDFFWDTVHKIIRESIADRMFPISGNDDMEHQAFADFYTYGMISVYRRWLENDNSMSLERLGNYLGTISDTAMRIYFPQEDTVCSDRDI